MNNSVVMKKRKFDHIQIEVASEQSKDHKLAWIGSLSLVLAALLYLLF